MRLHRSIGIMMVVASFLMLLAGCSGQQSSSSTGSGSGSSQAGQPAAKTYGQGVFDDKIVLGVSGIITGDLAQNGLELMAGMETAIAVTNAGGGVNGRKLELIKLDDAYQTPRQVANIRRLVDQDKVFALVGVPGSGLVPASFPFVGEKGIIMWGPVLPPDPGLKNVFLIGTPHEDQARLLVDYLAGEKGFKRAAFIGMNDELGNRIRKGLDAQMPKYGMQMVAAESVERGATDVSAVVLKVKNANPDVLIFGTAGTQTGLILKEKGKLSWNIPVAGTSSPVLGGDTIKTGGVENAEGLIGISPTSMTVSTDPKIQEALANIVKYGPKEVHGTQQALEHYGRTMAFIAVLKKMGNDLTWDNFIKTAESMGGIETRIFPTIEYKPGKRIGTTGSKVVQFQKGKWAEIGDWREPK